MGAQYFVPETSTSSIHWRDVSMSRKTKAGSSRAAPEEGTAKEDETMLDDALFEYRNHLVLAGQKAQEDYDKAVMTLSGGALGVSFAFLKDIVGPGDLLNETLLFFSWISWGLSVTAVLFS